MPHGGFVVNRVHPSGPAAPGREALINALRGRAELRGFAADDVVQVAADLGRTYSEFQALAEIDAKQVERIQNLAPGSPCVTVPLFEHDIYDLEGLMLMARYLVD
jgi:hypothetical protein